MALSWTMDKIGPIARSAEDCAVVFDALLGPDRRDPATMLVPADFRYAFDADVKKLRVGYLKGDFERAYPNKANDEASLAALRKLGVELVPLELPPLPANDILYLLTAEGGAAFDELTRSGRDQLMVNQGRNAWPTIHRKTSAPRNGRPLFVGALLFAVQASLWPSGVVSTSAGKPTAPSGSMVGIGV